MLGRKGFTRKEGDQAAEVAIGEQLAASRTLGKALVGDRGAKPGRSLQRTLR